MAPLGPGQGREYPGLAALPAVSWGTSSWGTSAACSPAPSGSSPAALGEGRPLQLPLRLSFPCLLGL